jgi:hypothetical protein
MMRECNKCGEDVDEDTRHTFAVYGPVTLYYHAECCPIDFDGDTCDEEHEERGT